MKIYLDVSCLNRPFDDQSRPRIRAETEAITRILEECEEKNWQQVSSEIAKVEIAANPNRLKRSRVRKLLPTASAILKVDDSHLDRADALEVLGFKPADALHIASAESLHVDVLLTCDDRMCRLAQRCRNLLHVKVANPVDWLKEIGYETDS